MNGNAQLGRSATGRDSPPLSLAPVVLGLALAMLAVLALQPTRFSLSYAGVAVVVVALIGWAMEARTAALNSGGDEEPPGPSYWPLVLALGIAAAAAGLVFDWSYGGMAVAVPMAAWSAASWLRAVRLEQESLPGPQADAFPLATIRPEGATALALEKPARASISRRWVLHSAFWVGAGSTMAATFGLLFDLLWPRDVAGFGGTVVPGSVDQFPPGSITEVREGRFWLMHLTREQGGPGFLALWWKCPHLGCKVPWRSDFTFKEPATGRETRGWFRCPCHGSTYTHAGVRVYGPAPRSMDRMELTIDPSGRIVVNSGAITNGSNDNARYAVVA
jgi:cytochrome b6-f complex iron-sulfur subunit